MSSLTDKSYVAALQVVRACGTLDGDSASMALRRALRHPLPPSHSWVRLGLIVLWHLRIPTLLWIPVHSGGGIMTRMTMRDCRTLHGRSIRGTLTNHAHSTCAAGLHRESGTGDLSIATTCFATMGLMHLSRRSLGTSAIWVRGVMGSMGGKRRRSSRAGVTWSTMMGSMALLRTGLRKLRWRLHINSRRGR